MIKNIDKKISGEKLQTNSYKTENQSGVALMMAIFFTALMSFLLFEISKETLFESISASQNVQELRAYYAAKAGEDISLLRIKAYLMVKSQIDSAGEAAKPFAEKANIIWEFPFTWPPILPDGAPLDAANELKTTLQETYFKKVNYAPLIQDLGSLIDINNLDSPSQALADSTKKLILELYTKKINDDEVFAKEYDMVEITEIINNIIDWMDEDQESLNGGAESSIYSSRDLKNIPPNKHFRTLSELLLVQGMTKELFDVIANSITTLGNPGINVNSAEKDVLMSLDPRMTDEIVQELIRRRQDPEHGPFNDSLFKDLIEEKLGDFGSFNPSKTPILYSAIANFKIESVGTSGKMSKTIITHVYDQTDLIESMVSGLKKRYEEQNPVVNPTQPSNPNPTDPNPTPAQPTEPQKKPRVIPKGPPAVVYRKVL